MKLKNKGQALVEFVIILPIVLMIIFVIIDFSNNFYQKNNLEGITNDIVSLKEEGKSNDYIEHVINDKNVKVDFVPFTDTLKIKTSKKVKLITPFSSLFFDNPFIIKTERTILYE